MRIWRLARAIAESNAIARCSAPTAIAAASCRSRADHCGPLVGLERLLV
jgi:hypothetical protein